MDRRTFLTTAATPALYPLRGFAQTRRTDVTIRSEAFYINGRPTYAGRMFNGKPIIERRGTAIALDSRMHDEAGVVVPNLAGSRASAPDDHGKGLGTGHVFSGVADVGVTEWLELSCGMSAWPEARGFEPKGAQRGAGNPAHVDVDQPAGDDGCVEHRKPIRITVDDSRSQTPAASSAP